MVDRTLLTHFDRVDAVGISGGTERLYHFLGFFESNVRSAYLAGFVDPTWLHVYAHGNNSQPLEYGHLRRRVPKAIFNYADLSLVGDQPGSGRGVRLGRIRRRDRQVRLRRGDDADHESLYEKVSDPRRRRRSAMVSPITARAWHTNTTYPI